MVTVFSVSSYEPACIPVNILCVGKGAFHGMKNNPSASLSFRLGLFVSRDLLPEEHHYQYKQYNLGVLYVTFYSDSC